MEYRRLTSDDLAMVMAMNRDFIKQFGYIRCQDLKRNGVSCDELIAWAAQHAEEFMKENL